MNKKQFAQEIADNHDLTVNEALDIMDAVFDTVIRVLVSGKDERIAITGVGVFETITYKSKEAWNLHTNTRMNVPERRGMRFRPGNTFKRMLRGDVELPTDRSAALKAAKTRKSDDGA